MWPWLIVSHSKSSNPHTKSAKCKIKPLSPKHSVADNISWRWFWRGNKGKGEGWGFYIFLFVDCSTSWTLFLTEYLRFSRAWHFADFRLKRIEIKKKIFLWPWRDLNTQPSDLESDALPLRHGVKLCEVLPRFELGSLDSKSRVLTITP